jgi:hypothetical protein
MSANEEIKEWWKKTLLKQSTSAHPLFGNDVDVDVEGNVVILNGTVEDADQIDEIEREARSIDGVEAVVNHLTVAPNGEEPYHMQTVIAIFDDPEEAKLACQAVSDAQIHSGSSPQILRDNDRDKKRLQARAEAARVGEKGVRRYLDALRDGKAVLIDRAPEDDILRVVSALEGRRTQLLTTLPPEPGSLEGD